MLVTSFPEITKMEIAGKILILTLLCCVSSCLAGENSVDETDESYLLNLVWKCSKSEDLGNCLKLKAARLLDKLVHRKDPLVITEFLSLTKNPKTSFGTYQELNSTLEGKSLEEEKPEDLDKMIWEKLVSLFTTRTVQLSLTSDAFEGRGKEDKIFKKGHGFFLMAAMMGGMMMKMALGKIALIAGKALIIGKIALILSLIIALKKFSSNGGGGAPEVVYTSAEHATGRKFTSGSIWDDNGADLAYNAYKPDIYKNL